MYISSKKDLDLFIQELQKNNKRTSRSIGDNLYLDYTSKDSISFYYCFYESKKLKKVKLDNVKNMSLKDARNVILELKEKDRIYTKSEETYFSQYFDEFEIYMKNILDSSEETLNNNSYTNEISRFKNYIRPLLKDTEVHMFANNRDLIIGFLNNVRSTTLKRDVKKGNKCMTLKKMVILLRHFYKMLRLKKVINDDEMSNIKSFRYLEYFQDCKNKGKKNSKGSFNSITNLDEFKIFYKEISTYIFQYKHNQIDINKQSMFKYYKYLAIQFVILTAVRPQNLFTLSESYIKASHITIPNHLMKMGSEFNIPLTYNLNKNINAGISTRNNLHKKYNSIKSENMKNEIIYSLSDNSLRTTINEITSRLKLPKQTLHGFRSSFLTIMSDYSNIPFQVLDSQLDHQKGEIETSYLRTDHIQKRKLALEFWNSLITRPSINLLDSESKHKQLLQDVKDIFVEYSDDLDVKDIFNTLLCEYSIREELFMTLSNSVDLDDNEVQQVFENMKH